MNVLVVDDEIVQVESLRRGLRSKGYHVLQALSAREALNLLDDDGNGIDLIITDYAMPAMNGIELLQDIRSNHGNLPVIMMTAYGQKELVIDALRNHCNSFIEKPFTLDKLLHEIEKVRRSETSLREAKAFTENALNTIKDIFFVFDFEGRFLRWNKAMNTVSGYSDVEISSMKPIDFFSGQDTRRVAEAIETVVKQGYVSVEATVVTKGGKQIPYEFTGTLLKDHKGNPTGISGTGRDIAERKEAEEQIREHLNHLAALRDIDMAITSRLDLRLTLNIILEVVTKQLKIDAADVLLLNPHMQLLEYAAGIGLRTAALQRTRLPLGKGQAGRAAIERRIISIPNLSEAATDFTRAPLLAKEGFVSYYAIPLITKGQIKGVLEVFHRFPLEPVQKWFDCLEALSMQASIAIDNAELFNNLQCSTIELMQAYDATIEGWSRALDYRDKETEGHSQRVTEMTIKIAQIMGISKAEMVHVRRGALLHDIGKMGIPDNILLKPGPLTDEEWKIMRKHPVYAYEMLSPITFLGPALDIPYCHHEKWDGTGYPRGLKGEQIPLTARIFAVVDVCDALRSVRPYRPAWSEEKTREYIQQQAGKDFDPKVVEVYFLKLLARAPGELNA